MPEENFTHALVPIELANALMEDLLDRIRRLKSLAEGLGQSQRCAMKSTTNANGDGDGDGDGEQKTE